jgi:hypothetical protein
MSWQKIQTRLDELQIDRRRYNVRADLLVACPTFGTLQKLWVVQCCLKNLREQPTLRVPAALLGGA